MSSAALAVAFPAAAVAAALLTAWFRAYGLKGQLLDIPNPRSSHSRPTPRGGGVAIVAVVGTGLILIGASFPQWRGVAAATLLAGLAVAAVGFLDDRRGVSASRRFAVHALACSVVLLGTWNLGPLVLPLLPAIPALHALVALVSLLWLLNLFNFMDGIDGIAAGEAAFVGLGIAACLYFGPGASWATLALCLAISGAAIGFLVHNWPPAHIFMGDVGSGFLGCMLGALAVVAHRETGLSAWVPVILLAAFVSDSTVTLLRRMARRERWYEAHRSHAYQWLSRRFGRHRPVTMGTMLINVTWLFPLALVATLRPGWAWAVCVIAYTPLVILVVLAGAGRRESAVQIPQGRKRNAGEENR